MKNIFILLFCTLLGASCTSVEIQNLDTNEFMPRFTLPAIAGESSFDVNSQKTYTIQNTPLLYTIDWIVLNATIISKNSTSLVVKFDKEVDVVNISANIIDKTNANYDAVYTARKDVYINVKSSSIIKGPDEISDEKETVYRLTGLSSYNYKNIRWFCNNTSLLSILRSTSTNTGGYSNEVIVKRKTKESTQVKLYAERKANDNGTITSVKNIKLPSLYTLDDVKLNGSQSINTARVQLSQLPEDYTTTWNVQGNGYIPYSQNNQYMLLKMNDPESESIVNVMVTSNGRERKFSHLVKPNFDVDLKIVFTYIGDRSGGYGEVYIYNEQGDEVFYDEFESYKVESVKSVMLKPGRYVIMGQGSPTENLQYSFEIKRGNMSDANRTMQMSLEIDERMWHPLLTTKSMY